MWLSQIFAPKNDYFTTQLGREGHFGTKDYLLLKNQNTSLNFLHLIRLIKKKNVNSQKENLYIFLHKNLFCKIASKYAQEFFSY